MNLIKLTQQIIQKKFEKQIKFHKLFINFWKNGLNPILETREKEKKPPILLDIQLKPEFEAYLINQDIIDNFEEFKAELTIVIRKTMFREKVRDHKTGEEPGCILCKERLMRNAFIDVFKKYIKMERLK